MLALAARLRCCPKSSVPSFFGDARLTNTVWLKVLVPEQVLVVLACLIGLNTMLFLLSLSVWNDAYSCCVQAVV